MNYYLLIPAIIVLIMFLPIQFEVRASLNFHNLSGAVGAFVFKKKMYEQEKPLISPRNHGEETAAHSGDQHGASDDQPF